jgi:hypothetical protein
MAERRQAYIDKTGMDCYRSKEVTDADRRAAFTNLTADLPNRDHIRQVINSIYGREIFPVTQRRIHDAQQQMSLPLDTP